MCQAIKKIEDRFHTKIEYHLLHDLYKYLKSKETTLGEPYLDKETENKILFDFIEKEALLFDDLKFSIYLDEGAEQKVFFDQERHKVIKFNDAIFYVNWTQYFESLIVHNILFTETSYELMGFLKINNILYSVVQQPYINATTKTKIESVKEYMLSKGFTLKKRNDYVHSQYGLIVEDLHEENVLTRDNVLFFIDTVIYLK